MDIKKLESAPVAFKSLVGNHNVAPVRGDSVRASKAGSKDDYTKKDKNNSVEPLKQNSVLPKQGPITEFIAETKRALER